MHPRFFEVAEANHRIQNPLSEEKLSVLGEVCEISANTEVLDLASGKGELLCQWAARHDAVGTGIEINDTFVSAARARAGEFDVKDQVTFVQADATEYEVANHDADIASCLGASWIGDGLLGTLQLLTKATNDEASLLLVGEPYWTEEPPAAAVEALADGDRGRFGTLETLLDRAQNGGFELIEMVLANRDTWDRYEAKQWKTIDDWLRENPDDPDADTIREQRNENRRTYLQYGRKYFGWGVFIFRQQRA